MRALIVEDEFTSRSLLLSYLKGFMEVDIAVDGPEAIVACTEALKHGKHYDLICLDIGLPSADGHSVLKALRTLESASGVPSGDGATVLMTTGSADGGSVMRSFFGGCEGYLVKPITQDALNTELAKHGLLPESNPAGAV